MAQKKAYSRYFIILQQDENGYSLSSDKIPSGYTKLETKNDKCKVSYYVQNLKKEMEPYYMLLICSKKDVKKLVKLGIMNIDEHGRSEITYEYATESISDSGLPIDSVTGAAIVKFDDSKIISVMSGFASADVPGEWRTYEIYDNKRSSNEESNLVIEDKVKVQEEIPAENSNIFDVYEEKIEEIKQQQAEPMEILEIDKAVETEISDTDLRKEETHYQNEVIPEKPKVEIEEKMDNEEKIDKVEKISKEEKIDKEEEEYPMGTVGEFFKIVAEGFEEVKDACKEIKRCRWYRVNVNNLEDMCNASNYNRYTLVYYPMMSYYPYIRKNNHFLMGYKYDATGKMKYIVYAIPGSKNISDQPYGGKSGFVTWVSLNEGEERQQDFGYWLMFYDFRTSTIVIPVK